MILNRDFCMENFPREMVRKAYQEFKRLNKVDKFARNQS